MTQQLRDMIEKALAEQEPAGFAERSDVYEGVRRRLERFIASRSLAEEQKGRLLAAFDNTIAEIEGRFSAKAPSAPVSPTQHARQGDESMTTTSPEPKKAPKGNSGRNVALAVVAVAVVAAAGGWYWWSQRPVIISGTLNCSPLGSLPGFERAWSVEIAGTNVAVKQGDWTNKTGFFDLWNGNLDSSQIELTGNYREGGDTVKEGAMKGQFDGIALQLDGTRGPRACSFRNQASS